ncbi:hypothetical protein ABIB45_004246 [Arthrobacter sp. UYCo732]
MRAAVPVPGWVGIKAADGGAGLEPEDVNVDTGMRRYLVRDVGIDRKQVAFMGYRRQGKTELKRLRPLFFPNPLAFLSPDVNPAVSLAG